MANETEPKNPFIDPVQDVIDVRDKIERLMGQHPDQRLVIHLALEELDTLINSYLEWQTVD